MAKSTVYFTKEISPAAIIKMYEALGTELKGNVAVKITTGEPGGHNFLQPEMIKDIIDKLNATIIECNTAYPGKRHESESHWKVVEDHGFKAIAPCDIMDEFGDMPIPVKHGFHLEQNYVGEHLKKYDSILVLSHFKGHGMGGLGGALKNISIGIGSKRGKALIHSAGAREYMEFGAPVEQDHFLESMADAASSVVDYIGRKNMLFINVANRLSVDCDCVACPAEPEMADIGIFASIDPVADDQACVDAVYNSADEGKAALIERIESRHGIRTIEAAAEHGVGSREYEIVEI